MAMTSSSGGWFVRDPKDPSFYFGLCAQRPISPDYPFLKEVTIVFSYNVEGYLPDFSC